MEGEIGVESKVGEGTTFWFTALFELDSDAAAEPDERGSRNRTLRLLVVDDSKNSREVICGHARSWGCQVGQAANASEALDELRRGVDVKAPYEIALIDACMPGIDGLRLARLVNDNPRFAPIRLILLSGSSHPAKAELDHAEIEAVVPKPVRASELHDAIFHVVDDPAKRSGALRGDSARASSMSTSMETGEEA
jgi:CheY-like chemotaxis protein